MSFINDLNNKTKKDIINNWLLTIENGHDYYDLYLITSKGKFLFSLSNSSKELFPADIRGSLEVLKKGVISFSNLKRDTLTKNIYFDYMAPIIIKDRGERKPIGVLILRINPNKSFYPLVERLPFPTETGESYIVRRDSNHVTVLSPLKYKLDAPLNLRIHINDADNPSANAAKGRVGIFEGNDYRGIPVLADIRKIPHTNWFIITKIDQAEIYKPINRMTVIMIAVITFLIILATLSNYLIWKFQKAKAERQKLTAQLEKQVLEKHFDYLIKYANDIIFLLNFDKKIIEANEAALKAYGYTREEFVRLDENKITETETPEKIEKVKAGIKEVSGVIYETVHLRKDGTKFPVEISSRIINIEDKKFYQYIIRDITERKNYQKKLERKNRVLTLLSNVNELIVRVHDRQKIFAEACKIAIGDGKFRMAWIGLLDDHSKKVNVVASYGYKNGYLDRINIDLSDMKKKFGPTGNCIITGEYVLCNDIETDESMLPWRIPALKNNYRSSAAFPIKLFKKTIGAFNLYSEEKYFFDKEEINLIDEMVSDISFALEFIKTEEERKKIESALVQNEKQLSLIYQNVSDILFFVAVGENEDYRFISINDAFSNTVGIPKNLIEGKPVKDIIPEPSLTLVLTNYRKAIEEKHTVSWEEMTSYPAGLKFGDVSVTPLFNEKGVCTNLIGSVHDITENKSIQAELIKSRQRYQSFFEEDLTGDYIALPSGTIITCNPSFIKMFGFSSYSEAINSNMYGLYYTRRQRDELLTKLQKEKKLVDYELEMHSVGGEIIYVIENVIGTFDEKNNLLEIKGYIINNTERKLAENELKKLSAAVEQSPALIIITDIDGNIEYVNPKFIAITGYSFDEVKGKNPRLLKSGNQSNEFYKTLWDTIKSGNTWRGELMNRKKDGGLYWESAAISPIHNSFGKITHFLGVKEDITLKKYSEEILIQSELQFRSVWENSADGMRLTNNVGRIIMVNNSFCRMVGMDKSDLEGEMLSIIYKPEQKEHIDLSHKERFESRNFEPHFEREMILWNDKKIWFEVTNSFIDLGENKSLILGIFRNITERKHAEDILRNSEAKLQTLVKTIPDLVWLKDTDGVFLSCNVMFEHFIGAKESEIVGRTDYDFVDKEQADSFRDNDMKAIHAGKPTRNEEWITFANDGHHALLETIKTPMYDAHGKVVGVLGIGRDITERKRMIEELISAKEKAEEMNRLKTNFLNNMSHEMRTPLVAILGFSQFLAEEILNPEFRDMILNIENGGQRLLETVDSILDLSKIEAKKIDLIFTHVDFFKDTKDLLHMLSISAEKKNLFLKIDKKSDDIVSLIDIKYFLQIVENLINNAIKYTKVGGVTVEIDKKIFESEIWSIIKVIDTGIGIAKESFDIIFKEFRQVSEGLSRQFEGTGLGLTLTKRYVEMMNGKIMVESELGKGSTFTVMFKSVDTNIKQDTDNKLPMLSDDKTETIKSKENKLIKNSLLVVEDDRFSIDVIKLLLKDLYNIETAENGETAVKMTLYKKYDCILMDINLGYGMNGVDAAKKIKENEAYKDVPIIAVTAYAMEGDREKFLSNGCTHYLSKPYNKKSILDLLNKALSMAI